jgi:2-keto-3-deoxy-L-rhamnonate aldolase RhmA
VTIGEYGARANSETMVIVQIETREAVENIDALLAVPGVDAALMGPADLSVALGAMDIAHPNVTESIQRVVDAAKRRGLPSGTHVGDLAMLKTWRDRGMRLLMYSYDFGLIMDGAAKTIKELRSYGAIPPTRALRAAWAAWRKRESQDWCVRISSEVT